jgi:hypothetical protein
MSNRFVAIVHVNVGIPIELDFESAAEVRMMLRHQLKASPFGGGKLADQHPIIREKIRRLVGEAIPDASIEIRGLTEST